MIDRFIASRGDGFVNLLLCTVNDDDDGLFNDVGDAIEGDEISWLASVSIVVVDGVLGFTLLYLYE